MSSYVDIEPEPMSDNQAIADEVHQAKLRRMLGHARADGRIDLLAMEHAELVRFISILEEASLQTTPDLGKLLKPVGEKDPNYGAACIALRSVITAMVNREMELEQIRSADLTWMLELAGTKNPPTERELLLAAAINLFRGESKDTVDPLETSEALNDHMRKARAEKGSSNTIHTTAEQYRITRTYLARMDLAPFPACPDHPSAFYVKELCDAIARPLGALAAEMKEVVAHEDIVKYLRKNTQINVSLSSCDKKADDLQTNCVGPISALKKAIESGAGSFAANSRALVQLQEVEGRARLLRREVGQIRASLRVLGKRPTC